MEKIRIIGKIVKVDGKCAAGHCVGEEFDFTLFSEEKDRVCRAPNVCGFLYNAIFPYLVTLQFNGAFPWEKDKDLFLAGCPDNYKVVIELKRLRR